MTSCRMIKVTNTIITQNVRIPYDAIATLSNKNTGKQLKKLTVKGFYEGIITSGIKTTAT